MLLILETEFNYVSIFTPNKLIFILYIFRNGIYVAKSNSILPANVSRDKVVTENSTVSISVSNSVSNSVSVLPPFTPANN